MQFETKNKKAGAKTHRSGVSKGKPTQTRKKQNLLIIAMASAAVLIVATIVLITVLPGGSTIDVVPSLSGQSAPSVPTRESYVPPASALADEEFDGTVLAETEDAGLEYVEETLFLGDSNTNRMMHYSDITGVTLENCIAVDSMGITSFETLQCVQFRGQSGTFTMPKALPIIQPKRVVITFGTNNAGMALDSFIASYTDAIHAIKENWEYCDIIIGGIFPVDQYRQNTSITMQKIDEMNEALALLAKNEDVKFLNWGEAIRDTATGYSRFECTIQDGVHLTREAMKEIFEYFRTHSYITEDRRPMPLNQIPQRIGVQPGIVTQDPDKIDGSVSWAAGSSQSIGENDIANVVFLAWDETNNVAGGGSFFSAGTSGGSLLFQVLPGEHTLGVVAIPADGYEFAYWSCSVGSIANISSAELPPFLVYPNTEGQTINVVATFRLEEESSSSSSSSSSSMPPSVPPPPESIASQNVPPESISIQEESLPPQSTASIPPEATLPD